MYHSSVANAKNNYTILGKKLGISMRKPSLLIMRWLKFWIGILCFLLIFLAAQIVLPTAEGTGCYLFLESMKGKKTVNSLQKPAS